MREIYCNKCGKVIRGEEDFDVLAIKNNYRKSGKYYYCSDCKDFEPTKTGASEAMQKMREKSLPEFPEEQYEKVIGKKK